MLQLLFWASVLYAKTTTIWNIDQVDPQSKSAGACATAAHTFSEETVVVHPAFTAVVPANWAGVYQSCGGTTLSTESLILTPRSQTKAKIMISRSLPNVTKTNNQLAADVKKNSGKKTKMTQIKSRSWVSWTVSSTADEEATSYSTDGWSIVSVKDKKQPAYDPLLQNLVSSVDLRAK